MASSLVLQLCETKMRDAMRWFIDHEVDLTTFAKPALFLGDVEWCKKEMHRIASGIDLSMEIDQYLTTEMQQADDDSNLHISRQFEKLPKMLQQKINIQMKRTTMQFLRQMKRISRQMKKMSKHISRQIACGSERRPRLSNEENEQVPIESCEIQKPCNVSNKRSKSSFNISADQNANLPFINKMCTDKLHCLLIEATIYHFTNVHRKQIMEQRCRESLIQQNFFSKAIDWNPRAANWKAEHDCLRDTFLTRVELQHPLLLRVIDIEATHRQGERVVLIDYWADGVQHLGYSAISHTYGMDVYEVFDCRCATECSAKVRPRCSDKPCPHIKNKDGSSVGAGTSEKHTRVVKDILGMCDILRKAGVNYVWHDGACIAQHDEFEVQETIKHMGWIYSNAKETIIFLHYVGNPMAPIRSSNDCNELGCRWHTRVWTLQEAALSKCRRYCVRVGASPIGDCQSLEEFEAKIILWNSSNIEIMEEGRFFELLKEIDRVLSFLCMNTAKNVSMLDDDDDDDDDVIIESNWMWDKAQRWHNCITGLLQTLIWTCFEFPTVQRALLLCGDRESKHVGDRINSILALAGVKDFVAPKDVNVEASTIEFFKRQGQRGLARAVFCTNALVDYEDKQYVIEVRQHTWPPILWGLLANYPDDDDVLNCIRFKVREEDGRMELRGELVCVKVRFTAKLFNTNDTPAVLEATSHDLAYLAMDLTFFDTTAKFTAKLSETPHAEMGDVCISALERCSSQDGPGMLIAREVGKEDGACFDAHLVIPAQRLRLQLHGKAQAILVQGGSLHAHVSKIGTFTPTVMCSEWLQGNLDLPVITTIQKLIII